MYAVLSFEKIFNLLLAIGVCSVIAAAELKIGNYNIQQFIIIMPSLYLAVNYLLFKKQKIQVSILLLVFYCFFSFLIGTFKFGLSVGDFASLFGFIILPIMINIFINIKSRELFIKYFIIIFSFLELITIFWFVKQGTVFNIWRLTEFREVIYIWPNHFAMMSAIKFGFIVSYKKTKNNFFGSNILLLISLITIAFSLSRTGMIMLIMIIGLPILLRYKNNKRKIKLYKIVLFVLGIVVLIILASNIIDLKSVSGGATTERTIETRLWRWFDMIEVASENPFFGTGFRSTVKTVGEIGSSHNDYLDLLLKSGVFGLVFIYGYIFRRLFILIKLRMYEYSGIIMSILMGSLVQNPLKNISIMVIFALLISFSYIDKSRVIKESEIVISGN